MSERTITVVKREEAGRGPARRLRAQGNIPAVIYGKGGEARPVAVAEKDFLLLMRSLENKVRFFSLLENGSSHQAIVRDAQRDPVTDRFKHVDFQTVTESEPLDIDVPINPVGEAFGVRTEKGTLNKMVRTLRVRALPKDMPERIDIDVTPLKKGEGLQIGKLTPPEGCRFLGRPDVVVVIVTK